MHVTLVIRAFPFCVFAYIGSIRSIQMSTVEAVAQAHWTRPTALIA
jgi:hypothetical protein